MIQSIFLEALGTRIGVVDVKSSPVQFSVEITDDYGDEGEKIKFKKQVLNIGDGFDWKNQWFRAPYPGTYFFALSGSKINHPKPGDEFHDKLNIGVMVNGQPFAEAISSEKTLFGSLSYQVSLKLNAGDKIELVMYYGKSLFLHFTGWLLDQNLSI